MRNFIFILLFFVGCQPAFCADVLEYDSSGNVTSYKKSVDETPYLGKSNTLIGKISVPDAPMNYWRVKNNSVVEASAQEKADIAATEEQKAEQGESQRIESLQISATELAKALVTLGVLSEEQLIAEVKKQNGIN